MSWQDDSPWSEIDRKREMEREAKERAEKGQRGIKISFIKIIEWFKNLLK